MAKRRRRSHKVVSQAQAGLFGIIAGGGTPRGGKIGISRKKARNKLRGVKVKSLPRRIGKR